MMYIVEIPSCGIIFLPSFTEIGTRVQAVLRICLRDFSVCNVGITDGTQL
jgi:hypothetical protein